MFFSYMGSECLGPSFVHHICFDLFQHTKKTDGELAYAFDLLVGINNLKGRYHKQVDKDNPLSVKRSEEEDPMSTKRSKEDGLSKTDEQVDKDNPLSVKRSEEDDPMSTKRSEEDDLSKTDGKSILIRHKINNEINPLNAIDKDGECTTLQHKEPHWVTETIPSYQMGSVIGNLRLLSPNILICL